MIINDAVSANMSIYANLFCPWAGSRSWNFIPAQASAPAKGFGFLRLRLRNSAIICCWQCVQISLYAKLVHRTNSVTWTYILNLHLYLCYVQFWPWTCTENCEPVRGFFARKNCFCLQKIYTYNTVFLNTKTVQILDTEAKKTILAIQIRHLWPYRSMDPFRCLE